MVTSDRAPTMEAEPGARWQWVLPLLALIALVGVVVSRSLRRPTAAESAAHVQAGGADTLPTVQLQVDYGDGVQKHFTALPWRKGMTVADALEVATNHRRGIQYSFQGAGAGAMLTAIDGLRNEGGGPAARNWIYYVNGIKADRSSAVQVVQPADIILWAFQAYEAN